MLLTLNLLMTFYNSALHLLRFLLVLFSALSFLTSSRPVRFEVTSKNYAYLKCAKIVTLQNPISMMRKDNDISSSAGILIKNQELRKCSVNRRLALSCDLKLQEQKNLVRGWAKKWMQVHNKMSLLWCNTQALLFKTLSVESQRHCWPYCNNQVG